MRIDAIPIGVNPPHDLNVVIECPLGGEPVKYELDKASGALFIDRILHTPMRYPCNYGFVPHTLADDGDPIDALIVARTPFMPGSIARVRPVGVLMMEDDGGGDAKLICVSVNKVYPYYDDVLEYTDLPKIVLDQIEHFFSHYKDLEPGKWVKCQGFEGKATAERLILESIERYNAEKEGRLMVEPKQHPGAPRG
jgi:inorganic pyrophosphatase